MSNSREEATREYLDSIHYHCIVRDGRYPLALGPVCILTSDSLNGPWLETEIEIKRYAREAGPNETEQERRYWSTFTQGLPESYLVKLPQLLNTGVVTQGPTSILCSRGTVGATPHICAYHWLMGRKYAPEMRKRMKREGKRVLRKEGK